MWRYANRDVDKSRQPEKTLAIPKKFPAHESWKDDTQLPKPHAASSACRLLQDSILPPIENSNYNPG